MNGNETCDDPGPRIGSEGTPRCRRAKGHDGDHRAAAEDGWGDVRWGRLDDRPVTASLPPDPADVTDADRAKAAERELIASIVRERLPRTAPRNEFEWSQTVGDLTHRIAAALAAERAAVTRPVLALAEEWDRYARTIPGSVRGYAFEDAANFLRHALAGPAATQQDGAR